MNLEEFQGRFENVCKLYGVGDVAQEELYNLMLEMIGEAQTKIVEEHNDMTNVIINHYKSGDGLEIVKRILSKRTIE